MSYHHREHVSKMRCIFKDMLNGTMQNLDMARCDLEETIFNHRLLPGKYLEEKDDELVVKFILPGIKKKNIDLKVTEAMVNLEVSFDFEHKLQSGVMTLSDKKMGVVKRKVKLPEKIIPEKTVANFENGILKVEMPKIEKKKSLKVDIS